MSSLDESAVNRTLAGVRAGHVMAGMPLTDEAEAMVRRILSGESSADQDVEAARQRALEEMRRRRMSA